MKKLLLKLIGDSFIKSIALKIGNRLLDKFVIFLMRKVHEKFGNRPVWIELQTALLDINVEDFLKHPETDNAINEICNECKND